jgi:hypothetical protein
MIEAIEKAKDLRAKMVLQIETIDKLILSLGIKELIPDFYENGKYTNLSISLYNPNRSTYNEKMITYTPLKTLEKRRHRFTVIINEQHFPADKVPDVIWEYAIENTKKQNTIHKR